jgi:hypothetical protein
VLDGAVLSAEAHTTRRLETRVANRAIGLADITLCGYVLSELSSYAGANKKPTFVQSILVVSYFLEVGHSVAFLVVVGI